MKTARVRINKSSARRSLVWTIASFASTWVLPVLAQTASSYPNKPIRFIVPYPPAGATDITARILAQQMSQNFGQQILIDNRGGAAGNIGTDIAAKSAGDGYTVLYTLSSHTINPALFTKLPFNVETDFSAITLVGTMPLILVAHPSLPATNVKDLISLAKRRPGALNYASAGSGTPGHLAGELFKLRTGTDIVHVSYKGGGPAIADVLSGQVPLLLLSLPAALTYVKASRLRALGVTSLKRTASAPDIPTLAEAGVPDFDVVAWLGALVPAKTTPQIITRLHEEFVKSLQVRGVQDAMFSQGLEVVGNRPAEFETVIRLELKKWAKLVADAGIRPE